MKYYRTNLGGNDAITAMSTKTLDYMWSAYNDGQGHLLKGYYIEEVSLSDDEFINACRDCNNFSNHQQKRQGISPFTEKEEWDGASPPLEMFNLSTENWVEIYPACQ